MERDARLDTVIFKTGFDTPVAMRQTGYLPSTQVHTGTAWALDS